MYNSLVLCIYIARIYRIISFNFSCGKQRCDGGSSVFDLFFAMDVHSEFSTLEWPGQVCSFFLLMKEFVLK